MSCRAATSLRTWGTGCGRQAYHERGVFLHKIGYTSASKTQEISVPAAEFFAPFGFFVHQDFLDAETCLRIRSEMATAPSAPATVVERTGPPQAVDEATRRTKSAKVSETTRNLVTDRLQRLRTKVEKHFDVPLQRCQQPQFLV